MSHATVQIQGQTFHLLPERAAFWEEDGTLLVADPHWGKAATFRSAGLFVPRGTTTSSLARLDSLLTTWPVRRLLFLGDFLHAREGRAARTFNALSEWRQGRPNLEIVLIRGNHDHRAGDPPADLGIQCLNGPLLEAGFAFAHHPTNRVGEFVVAGHVHPAVRLVGRGRQRKRLPCFWITSRMAVLPSFGEFTGMGIIEPGLSDRVFVVTEESVIDVSPEGHSRPLPRHSRESGSSPVPRSEQRNPGSFRADLQPRDSQNPESLPPTPTEPLPEDG